MPAVFLLAAAAAAISAASPVPASTRQAEAPAVNAAPPKPIKGADADTMICKSIATTGTRFMSRDCRTKAQWDQLAADSRDMTNDFTRPLNKYQPQ